MTLNRSELSIIAAMRNLALVQPSRESIFEGAVKESYPTVRSAEKIFDQACESSGIPKKAGIPAFSPLFVAHLPEQGVDMRYIQELPGHSRSKTAEIYTYVSTKKIGVINSPLDSLKLESNVS